MVPVVKLILPVVFSTVLSTALAQKPKTPNNKPVTVQKSKPKLTCVLGSYADSATVIADEAVQLVKLPLKISDDKKNSYTVSSYQLMYRRKAVTEDEESGKVSATSSNVAEVFHQTPLPDLWKNTLSEQLKPGEELFFFDIIAKDAQGKLMFAPDLKIKIK